MGDAAGQYAILATHLADIVGCW
ncbi:hypothetical protein YPPY92_3595, partial [Yersinia pestis PY-92]